MPIPNWRQPIALTLVLSLSLSAAPVPWARARGERIRPPSNQSWPIAAPIAWQQPALSPSADDCHGPGAWREIPGRTLDPDDGNWDKPEAYSGRPRVAVEADARLADKPVPGAAGRTSALPEVARKAESAPHAEAGWVAAAPAAQPRRPSSPSATSELSAKSRVDRADATPDAAEAYRQPVAPAPRQQAAPPAVVTAGMVDDNADFGEYLAYRERSTQLPVRKRDVTERYLLEVQDANGHPVPDAPVRISTQPDPTWYGRAGNDGAHWWVRTDSSGHAWLHPRAALQGVAGWDQGSGDARGLQVESRLGQAQGHAVLHRGQRDALLLRLDRSVAAASVRPRLDLVFLVDATGSMGDEIAKLNASLQTIANQIAHLPSHPDLCLALVAYRDRGDEFLIRSQDFTDRLDRFQQTLGRLRAAGGGDNPEALNEAWHETVHHLSWRRDATRLVVLVADAPPHLDYGQPYYDDDLLNAQMLGIKLLAVGASGLDPIGEYVFRQMAQYTGGRFVFLTYRHAEDPGSGPGRETVHDVSNYSVQTLDQLIVRLVRDELAHLPQTGQMRRADGRDQG